MVFVSNISSVVKEANSVAGFGLDPQFAETLSELLSRCRAAGLESEYLRGFARHKSKRNTIANGSAARLQTLMPQHERWNAMGRLGSRRF